MPKGPGVDQQPLLPSTVLTGVSCLKQLTRQGKEIITILFFWHETEAQGQTEELTIETRLLIKKKCQANNLRSSPSLNMNSLIITSNSCSISIPHPKKLLSMQFMQASYQSWVWKRKSCLFSLIFLLESWFLCLSTKSYSPHRKGTKDMNHCD